MPATTGPARSNSKAPVSSRPPSCRPSFLASLSACSSSTSPNPTLPSLASLLWLVSPVGSSSSRPPLNKGFLGGCLLSILALSLPCMLRSRGTLLTRLTLPRSWSSIPARMAVLSLSGVLVVSFLLSSSPFYFVLFVFCFVCFYMCIFVSFSTLLVMILFPIFLLLLLLLLGTTLVSNWN